MTWWDHAYTWLDLVLITPYRIFDNPVAGFYFGTMVLCIWCILWGEITFRIASGFNREYLQRLRASMTRMHNLSVKALVLKDKENYQLCNKEANEAFGKYFFNMITLGAAVLWPIPFALAWMNTRFGHIQLEILFPMPLLGESVTFSAVMIPMYILCRILWAGLKRWISGFMSGFMTGPDAGSNAPECEEMISMKEVDRLGGVPARFWKNSPPGE